MSNLYHPDYETFVKVTTKYGVMRMVKRGEHNLTSVEKANNRLFKFGFVILPEDGGLTLPDGRVYVTQKDRALEWHVFSGIILENNPGGSFPVKAKKLSGSGLENFSTSYSGEAELIDNAITEAYLGYALGVSPEDDTLVKQALELRQGNRVRVRELYRLQQLAALENIQAIDDLKPELQGRYGQFGHWLLEAATAKVTI